MPETSKRFSITIQSRKGYENFGKKLHIKGVDNVLSFIIWHLLNIKETEDIDLEEAKKKCVRRINYVNTPKRIAMNIELDDDTIARFERMYVSAGIRSLSAAIDLLGQALLDKGASPSDTPQFVNGYTNPFYIDTQEGRFSIRAQHVDPLLENNKKVYNHMFG